jgi:hypothetical protein
LIEQRERERERVHWPLQIGRFPLGGVICGCAYDSLIIVTLLSSRFSCSGWLSGLPRCLPRRWPGFDPRSRPDLRLVWKRCLFSVTLRRERNWHYIKFSVAKAKVYPHLDACTGPHRTWNTAFIGQPKLVNDSVFKRYMP